MRVVGPGARGAPEQGNWRFTNRLAAWNALDWVLAAYVSYVAAVVMVWADRIPEGRLLVAGHAAILAAMLLLPPRGAAWETRRAGDPRWRSMGRAALRFLRYTYPAALLPVFWTEGSLTVHAAAGLAPYWFEPYVYAADTALFGGIPAVMLSQAGVPLIDEVMHAFFFSYYPLLIGGIAIAWTGGSRRSGTPAPGFHPIMTTLMLGFFLSYIWYPLLPARGPWEDPATMAGLRPFEGWVFLPLVKLLIAGGSVSGACFPSAHISGTWALVFGLHRHHPAASRWFAFFAAGMSVACIYTRYHHGVDIVAGLAVALVAAAAGRRLTKGMSLPLSASA